jgi:predicted metal-binding transcription factor (methanogenesis marker protein 9)
LAFESENESKVFAMTGTKPFPFGDFDLNSLNQSKDLYSRWQKTFSRRMLPDAPVRITAWAFDASTGKAYRLNGEHVIEKPDK